MLLKNKRKVQNRPGEVKNRMGHGVAKELICMTHGPRVGECWWKEGCKVEGNKGEKKMGQL